MTLRRFRHNPIFRAALWCALWALLLPALLPLVHTPAVMAGMKMPMCHMAMGKVEHAPTSKSDKAPPNCPICQTLSSLAQGFVAPEAPILAVAAPSYFIPQHATVTSLARDSASESWPRAPPLLA
jgi:hypothetical protein